MRITAVTTTPLAIPLERPFHWRSGVQEGANLVLFAVETDAGSTGYGESICEDPAAVVAYGNLMATSFVGRSPGEVEAILGGLWRDGRWRFTPHWSQQILSGLEVACWDVLGKGLGVPASTFLGGRVRDEVDCMGFPQGDTAEELARDAAALAAAGHRVVYLKVGRAHRDDEEIVAAVREAIGPEPLLRVDANEAWDVPGAVDAIRRLEAYDLDWVEQPVAAANVAGLAWVRRRVATKIAADQAVYTTAELRPGGGGRRRDRARQPRVGRALAVATAGLPRGGVWDPAEPARLRRELALHLRGTAAAGVPAESDAGQPGDASPVGRAARVDPARARRRPRDRSRAAGAGLRARRGRRRARARAVRAAGAVLMDPITFEVIRNALVAATDEMVLALRRSAYSTNIKTRSDFSCAFFDADLRSVAQGFTQPVHLGSMVEQVPRAVRDYGAENLRPGDVLITNDPFPSGVHLNDV
ncbi:MAG: mandelate racemase/muconate lactonizing protein, partial [Gaiellaceae bacterium]|nr:mandelate racemase/muconate lactonizing protein [Gaiellaceae bacterium]